MEGILRPVIKWPGGKRQLLDYLLPLIPSYTGKYIEPFFGGGALYFAHNPDNAVLSDLNPELMNMYCQIVENVDKIISELQTYQNNKDFYYEMRELDWLALPPYKAAARTIYLNHTGYNGLYRVNKKGKFNVAYGDNKGASIYNGEVLRAVSARMKDATILCDDYKNVLFNYAKPGDFIYLDPPYIPVSTTSNFTRYTKDGFNANDHFTLKEYVDSLVDMGCYVILTNSCSQFTMELYSKYKIIEVESARKISTDATKRKGRDAIILAYPN